MFQVFQTDIHRLSKKVNQNQCLTAFSPNIVFVLKPTMKCLCVSERDWHLCGNGFSSATVVSSDHHNIYPHPAQCVYRQSGLLFHCVCYSQHSTQHTWDTQADGKNDLHLVCSWLSVLTDRISWIVWLAKCSIGIHGQNHPACRVRSGIIGTLSKNMQNIFFLNIVCIGLVFHMAPVCSSTWWWIIKTILHVYNVIFIPLRNGRQKIDFWRIQFKNLKNFF